MSSLDGFFSFNFEITNVPLGVYEKTRLKIPRRVLERKDRFYAKICAFCHRYSPGMKCADKASQELDIAFTRSDSVGAIQESIFVAEVPLRSLLKHLALTPLHDTHLYFSNEEQVLSFVAELRGIKLSRLDSVNFYLLDHKVLEQISLLERSSANWEVSQVDPTCMYLEIADHQLELAILEVDISDAYQKSIGSDHSLRSIT